MGSIPIAAPPIPAPGGAGVHGAIARAAQATGVDFDYLLAQARLESGLDPSARARTSSATGLFQFTGSTWLRTLDRHGAAYGLQAAGADRPHLLALRTDPELAALMAGELANDNRDLLAGVLGREPDHAELYLAHFLGAEGAGRFLTALAADPAQSAAALLPKAAAANRTIFFAGAAPRSVGAVMDLLRGRLDAAKRDAPLPAAGLGQGTNFAAADFSAAGLVTAGMTSPTRSAGGPVAREFAAAAQALPGPATRPSMAETLRLAFGLGSEAPGPAHVRQAYGRLKALGI